MNAACDFPCDLCGDEDAAEIEIARHYMGEGRLHVCKACGFVHVRRRRSAQAIADEWSDALYQSRYSARIPAVQARQTYVAETVDRQLGLAGKRVLDVGAGEGLFLDMIRRPPHGADVFGIEPSGANGALMDAAGIAHYVGTIETYVAAADGRRFDIVTILWTLENCQSCRTMLDGAHALLAPGGHVVVATGSRILVPFKKPLHYYLGPGTADTHAFRFSAHALGRALAASCFDPVTLNRYIDTDYLVAIARRADAPGMPPPADDWRAVIDFFARWHDETQRYYGES